ncbi:hypothetical protein HDU91_001887, partial [Kappamyces sp. JEL0680]
DPSVDQSMPNTVPNPYATKSDHPAAKNCKTCLECHAADASAWLRDKRSFGAYICIKCYQKKSRSGVLIDVLEDGSEVQRSCTRCCSVNTRNGAFGYICGKCKYKETDAARSRRSARSELAETAPDFGSGDSSRVTRSMAVGPEAKAVPVATAVTSTPPNSLALSGLDCAGLDTKCSLPASGGRNPTKRLLRGKTAVPAESMATVEVQDSSRCASASPKPKPDFQINTRSLRTCSLCFESKTPSVWATESLICLDCCAARIDTPAVTENSLDAIDLLAQVSSIVAEAESNQTSPLPVSAAAALDYCDESTTHDCSSLDHAMDAAAGVRSATQPAKSVAAATRKRKEQDGGVVGAMTRSRRSSLGTLTQGSPERTIGCENTSFESVNTLVQDKEDSYHGSPPTPLLPEESKEAYTIPAKPSRLSHASLGKPKSTPRRCNICD